VTPMRGAGDLIAAGLSAVGVTKERVDRLAKAVGLPGCGCDDRQRWFNALIPFGTTDLPQVITVGLQGPCVERTEGIDELAFAARCVACTGRECIQVTGETEQEIWLQVSLSAYVARWFVASPGEQVAQDTTLQVLRATGYPAEPCDTRQPLRVERDKLRTLFALFDLPNESLCWRTLYANVFPE